MAQQGYVHNPGRFEIIADTPHVLWGRDPESGLVNTNSAIGVAAFRAAKEGRFTVSRDPTVGADPSNKSNNIHFSVPKIPLQPAANKRIDSALGRSDAQLDALRQSYPGPLRHTQLQGASQALLQYRERAVKKAFVNVNRQAVNNQLLNNGAVWTQKFLSHYDGCRTDHQLENKAGMKHALPNRSGGRMTAGVLMDINRSAKLLPTKKMGGSFSLHGLVRPEFAQLARRDRHMRHLTSQTTSAHLMAGARSLALRGGDYLGGAEGDEELDNEPAVFSSEEEDEGTPAPVGAMEAPATARDLVLFNQPAGASGPIPQQVDLAQVVGNDAVKSVLQTGTRQKTGQAAAVGQRARAAAAPYNGRPPRVSRPRPAPAVDDNWDRGLNWGRELRRAEPGLAPIIEGDADTARALTPVPRAVAKRRATDGAQDEDFPERAESVLDNEPAVFSSDEDEDMPRAASAQLPFRPLGLANRDILRGVKAQRAFNRRRAAVRNRPSRSSAARAAVEMSGVEQVQTPLAPHLPPNNDEQKQLMRTLRTGVKLLKESKKHGPKEMRHAFNKLSGILADMRDDNRLYRDDTQRDMVRMGEMISGAMDRLRSPENMDTTTGEELAQLTHSIEQNAQRLFQSITERHSQQMQMYQQDLEAQRHATTTAMQEGHQQTVALIDDMRQQSENNLVQQKRVASTFENAMQHMQDEFTRAAEDSANVLATLATKVDTALSGYQGNQSNFDLETSFQGILREIEHLNRRAENSFELGEDSRDFLARASGALLGSRDDQGAAMKSLRDIVAQSMQRIQELTEMMAGVGGADSQQRLQEMQRVASEGPLPPTEILTVLGQINSGIQKIQDPGGLLTSATPLEAAEPGTPRQAEEVVLGSTLQKSTLSDITSTNPALNRLFAQPIYDGEEGHEAGAP